MPRALGPVHKEIGVHLTGEAELLDGLLHTRPRRVAVIVEDHDSAGRQVRRPGAELRDRGLTQVRTVDKQQLGRGARAAGPLPGSARKMICSRTRAGASCR